MPFNAAQASPERIYAIGDIHGRLDLFQSLLSLIRRDTEARPAADIGLVILGDVIDRGPQSAALVRRLMTYSQATDRITVLKGNHEEMMVRSLQGDLRAMEAWLRFGGDATLQSWGVAPDLLQSHRLERIARAAAQCVSDEELDWLDNRPSVYEWGDYLFVHAGLRPGVPLTLQHPADLLWIGDEFLDSEEIHPRIVVHGHTVYEDGPEFRPNRIGLDTGAYRTDRLTALGLEGDQRWTLVTDPTAYVLREPEQPGSGASGAPPGVDRTAIFGLSPAAVEPTDCSPDADPQDRQRDRLERRVAALVLAGLLAIGVVSLELRRPAPPREIKLAAAEAPRAPRPVTEPGLPNMMTVRALAPPAALSAARTEPARAVSETQTLDGPLRRTQRDKEARVAEAAPRQPLAQAQRPSPLNMADAPPRPSALGELSPALAEAPPTDAVLPAAALSRLDAVDALKALRQR